MLVIFGNSRDSYEPVHNGVDPDESADNELLLPALHCLPVNLYACNIIQQG